MMQGACKPDARELEPTPLQEGDKVSITLPLGVVKKLFRSSVHSYNLGECEIQDARVELEDGHAINIHPRYLERIEETQEQPSNEG